MIILFSMPQRTAHVDLANTLSPEPHPLVSGMCYSSGYVSEFHIESLSFIFVKRCQTTSY